MPAERLRRFAVGGAARPDALTGLNPQFAGSIAQMFEAAPPEVQQQLRISSAYRSPQRQAEIMTDSLTKRVGPEAAAQWQSYIQKANGDVAAAGEAARPWLRELGITKWVAPPGSSNHQKGVAVDLQYLNPNARQWMHANAANYGLNFPMSHENWHLEPANARNVQMPTAVAGGPAPAMQPGKGLPMMAQAGAPTAGAFGAPQAQPAAAVLAQLFTQQQAQQQQDMQAEAQRRDEEAAARARRRALFSGPSPFG